MTTFSTASDCLDALRSFLKKPCRPAALSSKVMVPMSQDVKTTLSKVRCYLNTSLHLGRAGMSASRFVD